MLPSLPLACHASALLVSYTPNKNGAGERNRTVVSALARPHSATEPHPLGVPSRIPTDNLTLRTRPLYVLGYGNNESERSDLFEFRKWYAHPVTLRNPALI